jgi:hypothetical protein
MVRLMEMRKINNRILYLMKTESKLKIMKERNLSKIKILGQKKKGRRNLNKLETMILIKIKIFMKMKMMLIKLSKIKIFKKIIMSKI